VANRQSSDLEILERLATVASTVVAAAGLFSHEFRRWHAEAIAALKNIFGEDSLCYRDFVSLQFELPREDLESLLHSQAEFAKDPEKYSQMWGANLPPEAQELKEQVQEAMRAAYENLSTKKKEALREIAKVLPHLEDTLFSHAQQRCFQNALGRAKEILLAGRTMLRNHDEENNS
jgi:hypothetical protein